MRPESRLDRWFARDASPAEILVADALLVDPAAPDHERSHGAVTRVAVLRAGVGAPGGIFDPTIFGEPGGGAIRFGLLETRIRIAGVDVTRVPVPPIADRQPALVNDPAARTPWIGAVNEALLVLVEATLRRRQLESINVPADIADGEALRVQWRLDILLAAMRGEPLPPPPWPPLAERPYALMLPAPVPDDATGAIRALLVLDHDRLLVQTDRGCRVVGADGSVLASFAPTGNTASGSAGDLVLFNAGQSRCWRWYPDSAWPRAEGVPPRPAPIAAYDLAASRWLTTLDERLPRYILDESSFDEIEREDLLRGESFTLVRRAHEPTILAISRDGRFAWLDTTEEDGPPQSALLEIATGIPFVEPPVAPADLPTLELGPPVAATSHAAIWHPPTGWRVLDGTGAIGDGVTWWARIVGATAATFAPDASLLVVATATGIVTIDPSPTPRVVGRW